MRIVYDSANCTRNYTSHVQPSQPTVFRLPARRRTKFRLLAVTVRIVPTVGYDSCQDT